MSEGKPDPPGSWSALMADNIGRFEVAAKFGMNATWNPVGSAAMAKILRQMCRIIDDEIEARRNPTT